MNQSNILPFDFIQCSSNYINTIKAEEAEKLDKIKNGEPYDKDDTYLEGIKEGTLYFVLDTRQILLGKESELVPMGGGSGVRFAEQAFVADLNPGVTFSLESLKDSNTLPQADDFVFNYADHCFYRVTKLKSESFEAERLTVAGSGGGSGGGGSGSGGTNVGSSQSVSYEIPQKEFDTTNAPRYIIANSDEKFTITNYIKFYLDDIETAGTNILDQIILIDDVVVDDSQKASTYTTNTITFEKKWFKLNKPNKIKIRYQYGSTQPFTMDLSLPSIVVLDLSIYDTAFKSDVKQLQTDGYLTYTGGVQSYLNPNSYSQKIYFKIKSYESSQELEGNNIYNSNEVFGETGNRHFFLSDTSFTMAFENLPYGTYTFEAYQSVDILDNGEVIDTLNGQVYNYFFIMGDKYNADKEILFICDLSKIDKKSYKDSDSIDVPIMVHVPGKDNENKTIPIIVDFNLSTGHILNGYSITSDTLNTLTLTDLPFDSTGDFYQLTIYLQDYTDIKADAMIKVTRSSTASGGAISLFKLNATGRRNGETNRAIWQNSSNSSMAASNAKADLTNFTWTDRGSGWTSNALRLFGKAKATIQNFNPFDSSAARISIKKGGRSFLFHFKVTNFTRRNDMEAPIINCTSFDDKLGIKVYGDFIQILAPSISGGIMKIPYTYNEDLHLAVCFSPVNTSDEVGTNDNTSGSQRGLIEVYINGILTAAKLYLDNGFPEDASLSDVDFFVGSENAKVDLYSIDVFRGVLKSKDVVKYYLSTLKNSALAEKIRAHNDIYSDDGTSLDMNKIVKNGNIPVMLIKGELPESKSDKAKVVSIHFMHPDENKNFTIGHDFLSRDSEPNEEAYIEKFNEMVNIEVQGTSSQFYPVKNWKLKNFKPNGEKYQLDENQVKTSTFCLKADYAESTGTHNTQNANFIENIYKTNPMTSWEKTTAQRMNPNCRTTIYGYPIVVFHQQTEKSPITFLGKYNFNFDKGSKEVFGFETTDKETGEKISLGECWEFCDNDDIAGMIYGAFDTIVKEKYSRYAWDKWKVVYYCPGETGTQEVFFPLDIDLYPEEIRNDPQFITLFTPPENRGFGYTPQGLAEPHKKCNSNFDYIKSLIVPYMQIMKRLALTDKERQWWSKAYYYDQEVIPMWLEYFEPRHCGRYLYDAYGKVIQYKSGEEYNESGVLVPAYDKVPDISKFSELYDWILSTGEPLKPEKEEDFIIRDVKFVEGTLLSENLVVGEHTFNTNGGTFIVQPEETFLATEYQYLNKEYQSYFIYDESLRAYKYILNEENSVSYPRLNDLPLNEVMHPTDPYHRSKQEVFSSDLSKYFDPIGLDFYYLYTHFAVMADQRAKNMFFTLWYPTDKNNNLIPEVEVDPDTGEEKVLTRLELLDKCDYGGRWCPWFYDNDTSFGIDNQGIESFDYTADDDALSAGKKVYQYSNSVLWRNLLRCRTANIEELYNSLKQAKVFDYNTLCEYFITNSAEKWPLSIYNEDSQVKYVNYAYKTILLSNKEEDADDQDKREEVINNIRGNGATHFKQFIKDRITYCDQKWGAELNPNKTFSFRPMNLSEQRGIDYSFIPYSTGAFGLYFGAPTNAVRRALLSNSFTKKGVANEVYTEYGMTIPKTEYNVTYLAPPESFLTLGDMSLFNPALFSNGATLTRLESLTLGNKERTPKYVIEENGQYYSVTGNRFKPVKTLLENYSLSTNETIIENVNQLRGQRSFCPKSFSISSQSLKDLDFSNIDVYYLHGGGDGESITNLDLSSCPNIRRIYCRNSTLPQISFLSGGGYLEELLVSDYYENFTIRNQIILKEENVTFENCLVGNDRNPYRNLNTIIIENCNNFNSKEFLLKSLHRDNLVENYNIPDKYLESGKSVYKVIRITGIDYEKDSEGNPIFFQNEKGENVYSHWVFANNEEFEVFVSNLEALTQPDENGVQPIILTPSEDKKIKNKIYLEGSCYVLGAVDGGLKKRLYNLIEGNNFTVYTSQTSTTYTARFYYIDLYTGEKIAIEKDGKPHTQSVYEGQPIYDPYMSKIDESGQPTGSTGDLSNDNNDSINYVPNFNNIEGYSYVNTRSKHYWVIKPRNENISIDEVTFKEGIGVLTHNLNTEKVFEDLDVYAVYIGTLQSYNVTVTNRGHLVPGFESSTTVKYGSFLYDFTNGKELPKVEYPSDDEEERKKYAFAGWSPDPKTTRIYGDTVIKATYNYVAYQTLGLLDKSIIEISVMTDKIPDYRFYNCKNLKDVNITYSNADNIVKLGANAFENSRIFTDEQKNNREYETLLGIGAADVGVIWVPNDKLREKYLADPDWSQYSTSIQIRQKGEE